MRDGDPPSPGSHDSIQTVLELGLRLRPTHFLEDKRFLQSVPAEHREAVGALFIRMREIRERLNALDGVDELESIQARLTLALVEILIKPRKPAAE